MSHRVVLMVALVAVWLSAPVFSSQGIDHRNGISLFRFDIPALQLPGSEGMDLDSVDTHRDDLATQASKTVSNGVRKCVYHEHPFRQASRAWDIIIAASASRFVPSQMIAQRLVDRMERLLLEYWVAIVDDFQDDSTSFQKHCKNVFRGICSTTLFDEVKEKCLLEETAECKPILSGIRDKILVEVFGNNPKSAASVAGAVGDDPEVIKETIANGNLRELMTLAFMKERALTPVFIYFHKFRRTPESDRFSNPAEGTRSVASMLDYNLIETSCPPAKCQPGKRSMNRIMYGYTSNYWVWRNNQSNFERRQRKDKNSAPPKVRKEDLEFLGTGLSSRELNFIAQTDQYKGLENTKDFLFEAPWFTGSHRWSVDQESDYGIAAYAAFLNQVAGPSGTTARSFLTAKALGFDDKDLQIFRLALLGYLVPWQHSLLEVVLGSAEYVPNVELDSTKIHTSLLSKDFLWNSGDDRALKSRFSYDDWMRHVRGQVLEYKTQFNKVSGTRMNEVLRSREDSDYLTPGEMYQHLVFKDNEFRSDDPLPLIYFFGGSGEGPLEFLTAAMTQRTLYQCLSPFYSLASSHPAMESAYESKSIDLRNKCADADRRMHGGESDRGVKFSEAISACYEETGKGCTLAFMSESEAERFIRGQARFGDDDEQSSDTVNVVVSCTVSAKAVPDSFKNVLEMRTMPREGGDAYIILPNWDDLPNRMMFGHDEKPVASLPTHRLSLRTLDAAGEMRDRYGSALDRKGSDPSFMFRGRVTGSPSRVDSSAVPHEAATKDPNLPIVRITDVDAVADA